MSGGNVISGYSYQLNADNYFLVNQALQSYTQPLYNRIYTPTGGMYPIPKSYINMVVVEGATLGTANITINNPFGGNVSLVINSNSPITLNGGMGVHICRRALALHNGNLYARSDEKTGLTIYISIPSKEI